MCSCVFKNKYWNVINTIRTIADSSTSQNMHYIKVKNSNQRLIIYNKDSKKWYGTQITETNLTPQGCQLNHQSSQSVRIPIFVSQYGYTMR